MSDKTVRETRITAGLTQAQAAALVQVSWRTWARYEADETRMPRPVRELFFLKMKQRR